MPDILAKLRLTFSFLSSGNASNTLGRHWKVSHKRPASATLKATSKDQSQKHLFARPRPYQEERSGCPSRCLSKLIRRSMRLLFELALAAALLLRTCLCAPARPQGEVYQQPDGTPVALFLKGDSEYSWMTDYDDFTVIRDHKKRYVYAKKMDGVLVSTGVVAGEGSPTKLGLVPNLKTDPDKRPVDGLVESDDRRERRRELRRSPPVDLCASEASASNPCVIKHLVVLVKFADHASRELPDPSQYRRLFNHKGRIDNDETLQFGSVADLFDVNSNGTLKVETTVSPWIQSRHTEAFAVSTNFGKNLESTRLGKCVMRRGRVL
jgi:hypothetical protein